MIQVEKKSGSFNSTKFWILLLSILLIALNFIVFYIYQRSHLEENLSTQLWNYFGSDAFKVITVSFLLPIILFLLESLFKIRKAVEERIEREKQRRRDARWQCVEETTKMWNELDSVISEVRYFETNTRAHDKEGERKTSVGDILKRLENLSSSLNKIVNMWYYRFPNLSDKDTSSSFEDSVHYFITTLFDSTFTIAYHIQKSNDRQEKEVLRETLGIIQAGVRSIVYHPLICILKDSIYVLDDGPGKDQSQESLKSCLKYLNEAAEALRREEIRNNEFFSNITGDRGKALWKAFRKTEEWKRKNPKKPLKDSKEYAKFVHLFHQIKLEDLIHGENFSYPLKWVKHLALFLTFVFTCERLKERAKWPK